MGTRIQYCALIDHVQPLKVKAVLQWRWCVTIMWVLCSLLMWLLCSVNLINTGSTTHSHSHRNHLTFGISCFHQNLFSPFPHISWQLFSHQREATTHSDSHHNHFSRGFSYYVGKYLFLIWLSYDLKISNSNNMYLQFHLHIELFIESTIQYFALF